MRIVFTGCRTPDLERVVRSVFPSAECRPNPLCAQGPAAFIAYHPSHLSAYTSWFPGLEVRVAALVRHNPLRATDALYLPVTFDSWVVVCDGERGLGAAMEAARVLHVATVVCPAFDADVVPLVRSSASHAYKRVHDRVHMHEEFKDR